MFFCFKFPLTWTVFEFLGRLKLSRVNFMCRILNFNGWGSHSNRLFLVNGRRMRSNGWHKPLVNGKPFENGKSLVYVFPSKVTNIKSLIMAVITRRFGCITLLHCTRKPCLHWMFIVARIYAILSFNKAEIDSPFGWTVPCWIIPHLSKEVEEGFALHHTRSFSY